MKANIRTKFDQTFTALTGFSVLLIVIILLVILTPIFVRGFSAVFFRGTVEFRKMQLAEFNHGNRLVVNAEKEKTQEFRAAVYEMIEEFKSGTDTEQLTDQAKDIYRLYGDQLRLKDVPSDDYTSFRSLAKEIRNKLTDAFESSDITQIQEDVDFVLQYQEDERFTDTAAEEFFELARKYLQAAQTTDLSKRDEYVQELNELENIISELFGPAPDQKLSALAQNRYGATRWDKVQELFHKLLWKELWVEQESSKALKRIETSRQDIFAGTQLEPLFGYIRNNLKEMFNPKFTIYWRYFFDDSTPGHYYGGIGPEILGTLLLTLLSMVFVIPFGVISAAYLTECTKEGFIIRIIRLSINTLAGVPSIVFGLFGLAFFVLVLIPFFGGPSEPCILAGSLTLAVLTLPVMIRSSEEAIRTVPKTYKEASLALGASQFRTFITVTLPAALPGILTGIILSLSRVAGETAPILFTAGVTIGPVPNSIFNKTRTLSYGSWDMAVGDRLSAEVPYNQFGMVVALILLILIMNAFAIYLRSRIFKRLRGQ